MDANILVFMTLVARVVAPCSQIVWLIRSVSVRTSVQQVVRVVIALHWNICLAIKTPLSLPGGSAEM